MKLLETNTKPQVNTNSIVSLTLGILSIFIPILGFITGIIGIILYKKASNQIAASNQSGKGLAIAGLICSIVGVISQLFFVLGIITFVFAGTTME
ncbi:DUF4190 domain-containing protein [Priestia aryabhattai]|nr:MULTISPECIES: DUF4190 domain-containing protein [Priestia]MEB4860924.1 DUF4190 domain-containing protein [Priestia megaterium]MED3820896.1 DUF4190 domain-containing protein [Priestia aryabhattai]MED3950113.1 DUF4190 domain-containing protein [Priestia aryabhattai]